MKITTPEISWHARDPIYSVDFQYVKGDIQRIATCGTDRHVRIWEYKHDSSGKPAVEFRSSLTRHTRTVNVVRFSPCGQMLASAGDDSAIMIWKLNENAPPPNNIFAEEDQDNKETWTLFKVLRSHLEDVYDLSWSQDGKYMISGSVDNSAIFWDVKKAVRLGIFPDHKSFVQGVAFDPLDKYLATMSADRSCRIYSIESKNCLHVVNKLTVQANNSEKEESKTFRMFHGDTMKSFFRRLTFTPDGLFLLVPAGCMETPAGENNVNLSYIFQRGCLTKPVIQLPGSKSATLAIRCCPVLFQLKKVPRKSPLPPKTNHEDMESGDSNEATPEKTNELQEWEKYETLFCLPYRMVFAIATEDSVILYDTQQQMPISYVSNIHYHTLSDIAWSHDGQSLAISSTDGYVTFVTFHPGELGELYTKQVVEVRSRDELRQKELEKQEEKLKKKKAKEDEKLAKQEEKEEKMDTSTSSKSTPEKEAPAKEPAPSSTTTAAAVTETEASQTTPSSKDSKKPRRVAITTLVSSSPSQSQSSSTSATSKVLAESNTNCPAGSSSPALQSPKTPRRVGLKTITKYESPKTRNSETSSETPKGNCTQSGASSGTPTSSKRREENGTGKKRLQVTTLETFDKTPAKDSENKVSGDNDLHLVMETTCDSMPASSSNKDSLSNTPTSSAKKAPRRVAITTLSTT